MRNSLGNKMIGLGLIGLLVLMYKGDISSLSPVSDRISNNNPIDLTIQDHAISDYQEETMDQSELNWKAVQRGESYNNELQYYSNQNVFLEDNKIQLVAKNEEIGDKNYSSGLVESTYSYKYGYFEFTISCPKGMGLFPAIWMLPDSGNGLPEIDIFEMIGSEPTTFYGVSHYMKNNVQQRAFFSQNVSEKSQYIIGFDWSEESLTWYIDGENVYTSTEGVPQEFMFLIINLAIGGNWPKAPTSQTIFPSYFTVENIIIDPIFEKRRGG